MPLVDVELISGPESTDGAANRLAEAIGEALLAPAGSVWVRLRVLSEEDFPDGLPEGGRSVFVRVLLAETPIDATGTLEAVTSAVAATTGRTPGEVHVVLEPPGADPIHRD